MQRAGVVGSAVAVLLIGLACGDGGGAASKDAFVASYCDLFQPCCKQANLRSDGQQCRLLFGALAPAGSYDKAQGESCLAEVRAAATKPDFCTQMASNEPVSCNQVFGSESGGSAQPGQTCSTDADCARPGEGKAECVSSSGGTAQVRKCQVQLRGQAGDKPCAGTVEGNVTVYNSGGSDVPATAYLCHAADGVRCDAASMSCVAHKAVGEACTGSFFSGVCVKNAYCDSAQKKCLERKAVGATCANTGTSAQPECVEGSYCGSGNRCTAQLAQGTACSEDQQCASDACVNGKCEPSAGGDFALTLICGSP